jgi:hypothetical protein
VDMKQFAEVWALGMGHDIHDLQWRYGEGVLICDRSCQCA